MQLKANDNKHTTIDIPDRRIIECSLTIQENGKYRICLIEDGTNHDLFYTSREKALGDFENMEKQIQDHCKI